MAKINTGINFSFRCFIVLMVVVVVTFVRYCDRDGSWMDDLDLSLLITHYAGKIFLSPMSALTCPSLSR